MRFQFEDMYEVHKEIERGEGTLRRLWGIKEHHVNIDWKEMRNLKASSFRDNEIKTEANITVGRGHWNEINLRHKQSKGNR